MQQASFWILAALIGGSALAVVTIKNSVHAALALGLCLLGVSGIFAMLGADFLFASQIMIYVTGVSVLIVFVVMMLGRGADLSLPQTNSLWLSALLIGWVSWLGLGHIVAAYWRTPAPSPGLPPATRILGALLSGDYSVLMEAVSLILTAALLGAVFFSHRLEVKSEK